MGENRVVINPHPVTISLARRGGLSLSDFGVIWFFWSIACDGSIASNAGWWSKKCRGGWGNTPRPGFTCIFWGIGRANSPGRKPPRSFALPGIRCAMRWNIWLPGGWSIAFAGRERERGGVQQGEVELCMLRLRLRLHSGPPWAVASAKPYRTRAKRARRSADRQLDEDDFAIWRSLAPPDRQALSVQRVPPIVDRDDFRLRKMMGIM